MNSTVVFEDEVEVAEFENMFLCSCKSLTYAHIYVCLLSAEHAREWFLFHHDHVFDILARSSVASGRARLI
jgi:hypothetical protein